MERGVEFDREIGASVASKRGGLPGGGEGGVRCKVVCGRIASVRQVMVRQTVGRWNGCSDS